MAPVSTVMPNGACESSLHIQGGGNAPSLARRHVLSALAGRMSAATARDAALIVSELVTNSVLHADVGENQTLTLEVSTLADRVRLAVIDAGSSLEPHVLPDDRSTPGGFGLRLVSDISSAWGVKRDAGGRT